VLRELAPYLHYLDSSATNGYAWHPQPGDKTGVLPVKRWGRPGDNRYGDVHFYNYQFDCEAAREFPRSKFVSEFGFLSVPNFDTWAEATDPALGDWAFGDFSQTKFGVNNTMTNYRSRRYSHINEILNQAGRHFRLPKEWRAVAPEGATEAETEAARVESERLYKQFFWLTNQQQAACYKVGTAAWRRGRSEANALTMGVLCEFVLSSSFFWR
jgi:beta-mannosidase